MPGSVAFKAVTDKVYFKKSCENAEVIPTEFEILASNPGASPDTIARPPLVVEEGWMKVRHAPAGLEWHPSTD